MRAAGRGGPSWTLGSDGGPPPPPRDPAVLFAEWCSACHRLGGRGGTWGPDLDRVGRSLTERAIRDWILDPAALDPDARMPRTPGMTPAEARAMARYVVRAAGHPGRVAPVSDKTDLPAGSPDGPGSEAPVPRRRR